MKQPIKIFLLLMASAMAVILVIIANVARSRSVVQGIEVSVRYGRTPHLIAQNTITDTILAALPDIMQTQVKDVSCQQVANTVAHIPYLKNIHVSISVSGKIIVRANQRRPVARLIYNTNSAYFDEQGVIFPVSSLADCNTIVASGQFSNPMPSTCVDSNTERLTSLYKLAIFFDNKKNYGEMFDQIYVDQKGILYAVPKFGPIVEIGDIDNLEQKFKNLFSFYKNGIPRAGWETYSQISLRFKDQVVCTRK